MLKYFAALGTEQVEKQRYSKRNIVKTEFTESLDGARQLFVDCWYGKYKKQREGWE